MSRNFHTKGRTATVTHMVGTATFTQSGGIEVEKVVASIGRNLHAALRMRTQKAILSQISANPIV